MVKPGGIDTFSQKDQNYLREGEKAKVVYTAYPEMVLLYWRITPQIDNTFRPPTDSSVGKIDDAVGGFKSGELNKISDLLDGSNGLVQKCSLNDIMFLVMLMMTKSIADQRQSRYEDIAAKKVVVQKTADTVYELKMAEAKTTYEAEKKQAILQIAMGSVQIVIGFIDAFSGGVSLVGEISQTTNKVFKAISSACRVVQMASQAASSLTSVAQGIVTIDIAKKQKKSAFISEEAKISQALFNFNMQQLRNMQSAYSTSNRNIQNTISSIKEILQQNQSTRLSIARNI